jgi:hypothetical protein
VLSGEPAFMAALEPCDKVDRVVTEFAFDGFDGLTAGRLRTKAMRRRVDDQPRAASTWLSESSPRDADDR